ncbi:stress response translation initiation inhibitor YciH [Candidatus Micrarchaeota archaeon]|nr:stress response translation initiation inhibitor YciH [Candidatus Micrarchaeota archaeon]
MPEICNKCGLIKDLCVCEVLDKEEVQKITVYATAKKFKKLVTIIEGIAKNRLGETAKELKHKMACGGTAKDGIIILQGDHTKKMKEILVKMGYSEEAIAVLGKVGRRR